MKTTNYKRFNLNDAITYILVGLMYVIVILAVIELVWTVWKDITTPPLVILEINQLLDLLGLFLLVLVAIELLDTITAYLDEHVLHAEVVFEAALIAAARKVILLDIKELGAGSVAALAAVILALAVGYTLIQQRRGSRHGLLGRLGNPPSSGEPVKAVEPPSQPG